MLSLSAVSASYGSVPAVAGISIEVGEGEAVGLLGANGAGKSTTLRAISGLVRLTSGTISFLGTDTASLPPYKITELGIAHVPEVSRTRPEIARSVVLLPAPLAPSKPTASPSPTSMLMPATAGTEP